jgi:preprotein translocase subunit SecG
MGIGYTLLLVLHIFICLLLILLVTVQNDKGGGLAGAFGGMGGGAFTGSSAVTFVTKLTQWVAIVSFLVLIGLTWVGSRNRAAAAGAESELTGGASSVLPGAEPATNFGPTQTNAPVPGAAPGEAPAAAPAAGN